MEITYFFSWLRQKCNRGNRLTKALPEKSIENRSGLWFVFDLPEKKIHAWRGANGLERVYVNDVIVSEHRSFGSTSGHVFIIDEHFYDIIFKGISFLRDTGIECTLLQDYEVLKIQRIKYPGTGLVNIIFNCVIIIATMQCKSYFKWSMWIDLMLLAICITITALQVKKYGIRRRYYFE